MTCPQYSPEHIPQVLSYEEIILLNQIAQCCHELGESDQAVSILNGLMRYYERPIIFTDEALRTKPEVLDTLTKCLALSGQYEQTIRICDQNIQLARTTGRGRLLTEMLYYRGWALIHRNGPGDRESAEDSLRQAYYSAVVMENESQMETIQAYYFETFGRPVN